MPVFDRSSVDTILTRSVSFAPHDTQDRDRHSGVTHDPVAAPVGGARPSTLASALVVREAGEVVNGYPVQVTKVQRPPVRDDTLARDRLLDWLHTKIHHRIVLVIAEAGYGKTTLLADFSARTRIRTLWYRLDETDANWVAFLSHLVAAGREVDPSFGQVTGSILADIGIAGPSRDAALDAFIRELDVFAAAGAAFVLDDYHLVDESDDVRLVMRRLVSSAPERVTFALSSRQRPSLPLARARAQGEVAELSTEDLRFDAAETERLFRETYGRPLEPDVLTELARRTEGWAASLQLTRAALREKSAREIRAFVAELSGATGEIHDYLAEEVLGDLPLETQEFLMATSVLDSVTPELAGIVLQTPPSSTRAHIALAERLGLISQRARAHQAGRGFHPLLRDLLQDRLRRSVGDHAIRDLHLRVAKEMESQDWRTACYHFAAAGLPEEVRRTIDRELPSIMGRGEFLAAFQFIDAASEGEPWLAGEIVRSRAHVQSGEFGPAVARAARAVELAPESAMALANLAALQHIAGHSDAAAHSTSLLRSRISEPEFSMIARASDDLLQALDQPLGRLVDHLNALAQAEQGKGRAHYVGIALLNVSVLERIRGNPERAVSSASGAISALATSSGGIEMASARLTRAWALAQLGDMAQARDEIATALDQVATGARLEGYVEAAFIETLYGSDAAASNFMHAASMEELRSEDQTRELELARAQLLLRANDAERAASILEAIDEPQATAWPDQPVHLRALRAHASLRLATQKAPRMLIDALEKAGLREAQFWVQYLTLLEGLTGTPEEANRAAKRLPTESRSFLSALAEDVTRRLHELDNEALALVSAEAERRPERWRAALRGIVDSESGGEILAAARLLEAIGAVEDVPRLRRLARGRSFSRHEPGLGRALARRVAPRVWVEDQLRVSIRVGSREVPGTEIRRKVLALLCFLLSRPGMAATRDQVVDALWPDLDPEVAVNSLNQTLYFLRRVFEPSYKDELSPGYVHHASDVIWLDSDLVGSRSLECLKMTRDLSSDASPDGIALLSRQYLGKFALDFAYEDWAVPYRDTLHAAYLQIVESSITADIGSGHFDRAIALARRAIEIDPEAEQLEVSLLRLYRLSGSHAAAAEQYGHYAAVLRQDLGIEPPPLDTL